MAKFSAEDRAKFDWIVSQFPGEKADRTETSVKAICPEHDDNNPSLGLRLHQNGNGPEVQCTCFSADCKRARILASVGLTRAHLKLDFEIPEESTEGCTVADYAESKRLPVEFLTSGDVGLDDSTYAGAPAIAIPYADPGGKETALRYRTALKKATEGPDNRFRWDKGAKIGLYGLHRTHEAHEAGYVFLVEGESDAHVAWFHALPAIGVPGANNWKDEWADALDGIAEIFVVVEPDEAGRNFWLAVSQCDKLRGRLRKVR
jgi:putative DNA primase/helicase